MTPPGLGGILDLNRGVAQLGSAPALGAGGRRFESGRPDHVFDPDTPDLASTVELPLC